MELCSQFVTPVGNLSPSPSRIKVDLQVYAGLCFRVHWCTPHRIGGVDTPKGIDNGELIHASRLCWTVPIVRCMCSIQRAYELGGWCLLSSLADWLSWYSFCAAGHKEKQVFFVFRVYALTAVFYDDNIRRYTCFCMWNLFIILMTNTVTYFLTARS